MEKRDFNDPAGTVDLVNEEPSPISGTRRTRSMSEAGVTAYSQRFFTGHIVPS